MSRKIFTRNDAREEKLLADAKREHALRVKECRAKVAHWKKRAAKFGGEIHRETLARFEAELARLTA